jgi:hypothetical protein
MITLVRGASMLNPPKKIADAGRTQSAAQVDTTKEFAILGNFLPFVKVGASTPTPNVPENDIISPASKIALGEKNRIANNAIMSEFKVVPFRMNSSPPKTITSIIAARITLTERLKKIARTTTAERSAANLIRRLAAHGSSPNPSMNICVSMVMCSPDTAV